MGQLTVCGFIIHDGTHSINVVFEVKPRIEPLRSLPNKHFLHNNFMHLVQINHKNTSQRPNNLEHEFSLYFVNSEGRVPVRSYQ